MTVPRLGGSGWRRLFTPAQAGVYVNDHCLVRSHDGRWHVFGIAKPTPELDPDGERWFCHGSGASLAAGEFTELFRIDDDTWLLHATARRGRTSAVSVCGAGT